MLRRVQVRRLIAAGTWLATTAAATALVWAATSVVAADVTDRPAAVVPHREVVMALQTESPGVDTAPAVPAPPSTTTTAPAPAPTAAQNRPQQPQNPASGPTSTPPSTVPAPAPTPPTTSPSPVNPPAAAQPSPDPTGTYATAGGTVTVACNGYVIGLIAATPTDGYAVDVLDRGPGTVDVHFSGRGEEIRVRAVCFNGAPVRIPDQHNGSTTPVSRRG